MIKKGAILDFSRPAVMGPAGRSSWTASRVQSAHNSCRTCPPPIGALYPPQSPAPGGRWKDCDGCAMRTVVLWSEGFTSSAAAALPGGGRGASSTGAPSAPMAALHPVRTFLEGYKRVPGREDGQTVLFLHGKKQTNNNTGLLVMKRLFWLQLSHAKQKCLAVFRKQIRLFRDWMFWNHAAKVE